MPDQNKISNIRHSLAHLLAAAVLELWPDTKNTIGPVIENGFYYDFDFKKPISNDDLPKIEKKMREILKSWDKFKGKKISENDAKKMFADNIYKLELIGEYAKDGLTIYKSGNFTDLCRGGHVKNALEINPDAFKLTSIAGAYWRGSEKNKMLTRIYGVAFENKKGLDDYLKMQAEAEMRDHRKLGAQLDLYSFHDVAPGAVFWHGKGQIIWRELEKFMREKLDRRNYQEVSTPIMVKKEVFEKSGHWEFYKESGFWFKIDKETYVLKPMNCPESTYIYASGLRSYKDLPLRLSEITGRLHRQELSGVLGGLFRLRQFTQDDAHIYCREDQIEEEIENLIALTKEVYGVFKMPLSFHFATRPDKAMGDPKLWRHAEKIMEDILKKSKIDYSVKAKDAAFYGPKIDVHIKDAINRDWQLATIQLDFQMPERFDLNYIDEKGKKQRPVMIHRAILGSFERFIGVLVEHFAGAFPLWLAPIQVKILPISDKFKSYCLDIIRDLKKHDLRIEFDDSNETINKKIRNAELEKIPYMLIIGEKEKESNQVAIRERKSGDLGQMPVSEFIEKLKKEIEVKS